MNYKVLILVISLYVIVPIFLGNTVNRHSYCNTIGQALIENINKKSGNKEFEYECNSDKNGDSINITEKYIMLRLILYIMGFEYISDVFFFKTSVQNKNRVL